MLGMNRKLKELEEKGTPIRTSIVGAGQMGKGMVSQMMSMKGMIPSVVVDIQPDNAMQAYLHSGLKKDDIKVVGSVAEANKWMEQGKYIVTDNASVATDASLVNAVVDATGVPEVGAKVAFDAIMNKKHIVMLNVETDIVIGHLLKKMADNAGVVYTGSAGDEPGAVKELYDFSDAMGFEVLIVGKGKNNKLDYDSNPTSVLEEATRRGVSPKMLTSFKDGTKTMVEMTAMANATGYTPDIMGAHGPAGSVDDLKDLYQLKSEGGFLNKFKIVDYVNGVAPGVFVIVTSKLPGVHEEMQYLSMGQGPNYALYRPYHLCSLETPLSVAKAVLDNQSTIVPLAKPVAETVAVAKIDLKAGDTLDGIGGYTVYGTIITVEDAKVAGAVPLGLINKKSRLTKDVLKGSLITYDMVTLDRESLIVKFRDLQDLLI